MQFEKKSNVIFSIFFMYNEGKFENVRIDEKDIYHILSNHYSEARVLNYLQKNIGDGFLIKDLVFDDEQGYNGVFYLLTKKGIDKIREIFNLDLEDEFPDEIKHFQSLYFAFIASNLPKIEKEAYDTTMSEIIICYKTHCLNAAIALCGKLLEIYLTELLMKNKIEIKWFQKGPKDTAASFTEDLSFNQLFILAKTRLPVDVKLASLDETQIELIKRYRNGVTHHNKSSINPSKEVTLGIIQFVSHFLKHRLSWQ